MSQSLSKLFGILQAANKTVKLAVYKRRFVTPETDAIEKGEAVPKQITAFQKYAFKGKPNKTGGTTWKNIRIFHNEYIQDILEDNKEEFPDVNFGLYLQAIQHHDVQVIGWLMHMFDRVYLDY